jgi:hypothetical protein
LIRSDIYTYVVSCADFLSLNRRASLTKISQGIDERV